MLINWYHDPEAFSDYYEEYRQLLRDLAQDERGDFERDALDLVREAEEAEDNYTDAEADADTLASAGMGTDEDYGYYGGE